MKAGQRSRGNRRGNVFSVRVPPELRPQLEQLCARDGGPKALGPWLLWRALQRPRDAAGTTAASGNTAPGKVLPRAVLLQKPQRLPPVRERLILDLCAGSGAWSEPYKRAGYPVRRVTLPRHDVRTYVPPEGVWGVLAAPPCTEFSLAKNGRPRDFAAGLELVSACLRIVMRAQPQWWALENPTGYLSRWLGPPADVFEPADFGDPWSKRTALWGSFRAPERGPFVTAIDGGGPLCAVCYPDNPRCCSLAGHRAITPPGFARAFFESNR